MQFLIRHVGRKKSQKLIQCAAWLFGTTEFFFLLEKCLGFFWCMILSSNKKDSQYVATTISDLPKQFLACVHSPSLFNPRPKTTRRHCILCDKNIQQNSLPWLFQCHNQSKVGRQRSDRDHLDCRHRFYSSDVMP